MSLPVCSSYHLVWVRPCTLGYGRVRHWRSRARRLIGFEDIEPLELLIEDRQWLELLRFDHLCLEPILDFILLHLLQTLVVIVKVSMVCETLTMLLVETRATC